MKTTKRLISLFAGMCISALSMAEVVYEPLIVDSGFNRDCIAEAYTPSYSISPYATSYLYASGITYCFATKDVIHTIDSVKNFTPTALAQATETGWPNDYRDTIWCIEDAKTNDLYKDVFWLLAPYDQPNVLTVRPDSESEKPNQPTGTLKFKKIGCYTRLFFLIVCPKLTGQSGRRYVKATVYYTDGTHTPTAEFDSKGFGGQPKARVCKINCYESGGYFEKNTNRTSNTAFACAYDIELDSTKLVDRIVFQNDVNLTAAVILAVTGRTADIDAPDDESTEVNDVDKTSFQACWDAIEDAASYRIDVAEDIDFQRILEDYNNLPVSGSTCQDIVDLVSNTDYYWRVRSVNADGGQSASSAPRRVKTAPDPEEEGYTHPYTDETYTNIEEQLGLYLGLRNLLPDLDIHRTLWRDGAYNTLCLPFNLNAEEIATSPLAGAQVYEYVRGTKIGDSQLNIEVSATDHIEAGVPYLIKWAPTEPQVIDGGILKFKNVNVVTNHGQTLGGSDEVRFVGNIGIAHMVVGDHDNLFLGAANTLYWPDYDEDRLKGFRAYFQVPTTGPNAAPKNTPARIVETHDTPTDIESVSQQPIANSQKLIIDGQIYLMYEGRMYDVLGKRVK